MDAYLIEYLKSGDAWLLVGSGPSTAAGYPGWSTLAKEAVRLCKTEAVGHDLKTLESILNAEKYPDVLGEAASIIGMPRLLEYLRRVFKPQGDGSAGDSIYKQLSRWPAPVYLTTNYDNEITKHLSAAGERSYLSYSNSEEHMSLLIPSFSGAIVHLHGDLRAELGLVLTGTQYKQILTGSEWEYWRTKMTSIFQMNRVIIVGHSLFDPHIRHILEAAKKGSGVVQPVCWIAPDVPFVVVREYLEKYRIRVITYDNRDGTHANLARLIESVSDFVPPRLSIHVSKAVANASVSPLGSDAAAPGFFVFTQLAPYTDFEAKRIEIMIAALKSTMPLFSTRSFSIEEALQSAGWPKTLPLDPQLSEQVSKRAISENLLEMSGALFVVSAAGLKIVEAEQRQFAHLRARFQQSLQNRLRRLFPSLESPQADDLATDIDVALAGYFREGGLTLASTVLTTGSAVPHVVPSSVLKFINEAAAKYGDHLRRQAFSTVSLQVFLRPESADREYLGRVSQGFFAFHFLGVFGDAAAERLKHIKDTVWLVDSSVQIPAIAANCSIQSTFRDAFSKLTTLGVRVYTTESLFDETREHLWFANNLVKQHGVDSPAAIAAAMGDLPYRKANRFLEGFINWRAAGNPANWEQYLVQISGKASASEDDARTAIAQLPIEVISFTDWPGFQIGDYAEAEDLTQKIVAAYESGATRWSEFADLYKKARPEAEALVIVLGERTGHFHMLSDERQKSNAWFISETSGLNKVAPGQRITWRPEAFLRLLATLAPTIDQAAADKAFEALVWSLAQSGITVLDDRVVAQVFGGVIDQAKLTIQNEHVGYEKVLASKYGEPMDSVMNRVPPSQQPLAALQLANERSAKEAELRSFAQKTAEEATKQLAVAKAELRQLARFKQKLTKKQRQADQRKRKALSNTKRKKGKKR